MKVLSEQIAGTVYVITSATNANPAVLTLTSGVGHVIRKGSWVSLYGLTGGTWSTLTSLYLVTSINTTAGTITIDVDSSTLGTLTGGNVQALFAGRFGSMSVTNISAHASTPTVTCSADILGMVLGTPVSFSGITGDMAGMNGNYYMVATLVSKTSFTIHAVTTGLSFAGTVTCTPLGCVLVTANTVVIGGTLQPYLNIGAYIEKELVLTSAVYQYSPSIAYTPSNVPIEVELFVFLGYASGTSGISRMTLIDYQKKDSLDIGYANVCFTSKFVLDTYITQSVLYRFLLPIIRIQPKSGYSLTLLETGVGIPTLYENIALDENSRVDVGLIGGVVPQDSTDIAASILEVPGNKILTDSSGYVQANVLSIDSGSVAEIQNGLAKSSELPNLDSDGNVIIETVSINAEDVENACTTSLTNYGTAKTSELPNLDSDGNAIVSTDIEVNIGDIETKIDGIKEQTDKLAFDSNSNVLASVDDVIFNSEDITAIKAQTDKLTFDENNKVESVVDGLENVVSVGFGPIAYIYTVYSGGSVLVPNAAIYVYNSTTLTKENLVAYAVADDFGKATLYLYAGTYYFVRLKAGYVFSNPVAVTVTE